MHGPRWVMVLVVALAAVVGSGVPVSAQGVGGLVGLEQVVTRTFRGPEDAAAGSEPATSLRDHVKPELALLVLGVYVFDSDANAAAAFNSGEVTLNANGIDGEPLPLTDVQLPFGMEHIAATAIEERLTPPYNYVVASVLDGRYMYAIVQITSGAPPEIDAVATIRAMAAIEEDAAPAAFVADGTSTGGVWAKFPTLDGIGWRYRGAISVEDAIVGQS